MFSCHKPQLCQQLCQISTFFEDWDTFSKMGKKSHLNSIGNGAEYWPLRTPQKSLNPIIGHLVQLGIDMQTYNKRYLGRQMPFYFRPAKMTSLYLDIQYSYIQGTGWGFFERTLIFCGLNCFTNNKI